MDQAEIRRRSKAARELVGLKQVELERRLAQQGLGKGAGGRLERGSLDYQAVHIDALARATGLPRGFFTMGRSELLETLRGVLPDDPALDLPPIDWELPPAEDVEGAFGDATPQDPEPSREGREENIDATETKEAEG